jgi:putative spermidine/putrescine transport system permease protein
MGAALSGALALFVLAPLAGLLSSSLTTSPFWQFPPNGLTLKWYGQFFGSVNLVSSMFVSLGTALLVAVLGSAVGLLGALAIARHPRGPRSGLKVVVLLPLLVPHLALGLAIYVLYARIQIPVSVFSIGAAQLIIVLPLIVGLLVVALDGVPHTVERAAANLGAPPRTVFFRVTLPMLKTALIASAVIAFVRSFDDASLALFLTSASTVTLPVRMLTQMEHESGPLVAVGGSVLLIIGLIVALIVERTVGLSRAFGIARRES